MQSSPFVNDVVTTLNGMSCVSSWIFFYFF